MSPPPQQKESSSPSFSMLPNDITINYLARIPRSYYSILSLVSKSFYSLLSSTDLYRERSLLGNTEQCLYVYLWDSKSKSAQWCALWINSNQTARNSSRKTKKKKKNRQLLVQIPPSNIPLLSYSTVAVVGSEIYVMGGLVDGALSSAVQVLDCRSHTWRDAPSMNVARHNAVSCFYDDKIYVIGGYRGTTADDESWAEVFDTETQTWEHLSCPYSKICKGLYYKIAETEGKIYISNFSDMPYAYDTKQGKWECCNNTVTKLTHPRPMCMIENVIYSWGRDGMFGQLKCWWYDTNAEKWREVEGLNSLRQKWTMNGNSYYMGWCKLVSCGRKLLLMWEAYTKNNEKKIWCAEIVVENQDGDEVLGNVEWVGILENIPSSYDLLHLLVVSV